jgi:hypothetical protein
MRRKEEFSIKGLKNLGGTLGYFSSPEYTGSSIKGVSQMASRL